MRLYKDQRILLRKNMKIATVVKKVQNKEKWIVTYYNENNKFVHDIISEIDIVDDMEYEKIKKRINLINEILK